MMRYFVGFLLTIGLIVLLIIMLFSGSERPQAPSEKPLSSYASTNALAILTLDGPINAPDNHDTVRITVGRDQVTYEQIKGYDNDVVKEKTFSNSENSFEVFLSALARSGFRDGSADPNLRNEKGACPTGSRYIYELIEDGRQIQRYWSSTCDMPHSFQGQPELVQTIFREQIPGFDDLVQDLSIDT